jgi:membrane protein implicated in regulation of membrane protease activity
MKLKDRLAKQFKEYPRIAVYTYFTMSILTIIAFSVAIGIGAQPSSATGTLGVIGAGWVAAKATLPIRILATLGLTPVVAAVVKRLRRRPDGDSDDDDEQDEDDQA